MDEGRPRHLYVDESETAWIKYRSPALDVYGNWRDYSESPELEEPAAFQAPPRQPQHPPVQLHRTYLFIYLFKKLTEPLISDYYSRGN